MVKILILFFTTKIIADLYILYPIPTLEIEPSTSVVFDISPYLYNTAPDKTLIVKVKDNILTKITFKNGLFYITSGDKEGYDIPEIAIRNTLNEETTFSVLVKIKKERQQVFLYKPSTPVKKIYLAGEFNSWNPKATELTDTDGNGIYTVKLKLSPGRYQYKFVVDGKWLPDPNNPERAPDGFGGFNSVITIEEEKKGYFVGQQKDINLKLDTATFRARYYGDKKLKLIGAMINNSKVPISYKDEILDLQVRGIKRFGDFIKVRIYAIDENGNNIEYSFKEKVNPAYFDWRDAIIYFIMIDRFFNGDEKNDRKVEDAEVSPLANYMGGDIAGIIQKIKEGYFKRLGVNTLWISPFYDNPEVAHKDVMPPHHKFTGYHGYWPKDLYSVEENFGTEEELINFVKVAHKNNLKVMFDMVLNHVYDKNEIYIRYPSWFSSIDLGYGKKNIRLFDERPLDTWFDVFLPDINYDIPQAVDYMVEHCIHWIKKTNVDGFRLDAVKHIPDVLWKSLRKRIRTEIEIPTRKEFYLLGETISSRDKIMEWVNIDEITAQFDFPLFWIIRDVFAFEKIGFDKLHSETETSMRIYGDNPMCVFLGNHDFARFMAYADGDIKAGVDEKLLAWTNPPSVDNPDSYKKLKLAFVFLMSLNYPIMIYYGDEIGLTGAGDPDNRRMMTFEREWDNHQIETFKFVSNLIHIRRNSQVMKYGDWFKIHADDELYIYAKKYFQEEAIIIINRSHEKKNIEFKIPKELVSKKYDEKISKNKYRIKDNVFSTEINRKSALVFLNVL